MVKKINDIPEGVKILAVLYFFGTFVLAFIGMFMFNLADAARLNGGAFVIGEGAVLTTGVAIGTGFGLIIVAVLSYLIAKGLLRAKNWARMILIVLAVLGIISGILNMISGIYFGSTFALLINGIILWYLFFREDIKKYFK